MARGWWTFIVEVEGRESPSAVHRDIKTDPVAVVVKSSRQRGSMRFDRQQDARDNRAVQGEAIISGRLLEMRMVVSL
jgi:hypothetical protein